MSSAGSFQGLQFRIMETLENQPNGAPLTALEIADILHQREYRNEMKDNVVFKVSRAVHGMKEQGKIVVSDARDKEGRLCYQLPTRVKFPPKISDNPANPVLTPEIAAKVQTVAPKLEPSKRAGPPRYVPDIGERIIAHLDKAPHPLTASDLVKELGPLYGDKVASAKQLVQLFSGNLSYLVKHKRRAFRRKVTGYGPGIRFEYYTRKTGTAPHPLAKRKAQRAQIAEAQPPVEQAPLPSRAWPENRPSEVPKVAEAPAMPGLFRPKKPEDLDIELRFRVPAAWNNRLVAAAHTAGISITEFMRQAVDYAIEHMDAS